MAAEATVAPATVKAVEGVRATERDVAGAETATGNVAAGVGKGSKEEVVHAAASTLRAAASNRMARFFVRCAKTGVVIIGRPKSIFDAAVDRRSQIEMATWPAEGRNKSPDLWR